MSGFMPENIAIHSIAEAQALSLLPVNPVQGEFVMMGYVKDPDVLGQIQKGFKHFVDSGQIWAMILGFMLGYWFSSLRSG